MIKNKINVRIYFNIDVRLSGKVAGNCVCVFEMHHLYKSKYLNESSFIQVGCLYFISTDVGSNPTEYLLY